MKKQVIILIEIIAVLSLALIAITVIKPADNQEHQSVKKNLRVSGDFL